MLLNSFKTALIILLTSTVWAITIPRLSSPVIDQAGLLSSKVTRALASSLIQIKKQTGTEIAVLTIDSLEGEPIENYSIAVVDKWKLGKKGKDNGVLFLISLKDRKMRIEVGRGLEGDIPDITAGRIISGVGPYFKTGDYQSGVIFGVSQIANKLGYKLTNSPRYRRQAKKSSPGGTLLFIIVFIILSFMTRGRGGFIFLGGGGYGGGGGFSGGSGGFGGGGGFSGGGASGDW